MKLVSRPVGRAGKTFAGFALVAGLLACSGSSGGMGWPPSTGAGPCQVTTQADVPARTRDGTVLKADVYRPATPAASPVILMRTQYGKAGADVQPSRFQTPAWFASHCYLVVVQDIRGQGASGGTFYEYANDADDGYDTVEWAAALPGSNGKVGMYGTSYVGATQWLAAIRTPPHLVTIVPANTSSDYYQNWTYEDGAFRLAFIEPWMMDTSALSAARQRGDRKTVAELTEAVRNAASWEHYRPYATFPPLRPDDPAVAPYFFDAIRHPTYDEYWKRWSIRDHYDQVTAPVLDFEGWYDAFLAGGLDNFTPTSYLFPAGSRIRLEISSSDFPQFASNPNTGQPFGTDTTWQAADQTIYHDPTHPSSVLLPIVPPDNPAVHSSRTFPLSE